MDIIGTQEFFKYRMRICPMWIYVTHKLLKEMAVTVEELGFSLLIVLPQ